MTSSARRVIFRRNQAEALPPLCKGQCRQLNAQQLSFVMLSEAVGEVETSKNKILRLRYRFTQDDIKVVFP